MGDISRLRTDLTDEHQGRWITWIGGIKLKIRRNTYPPFQEAIRKLKRDQTTSYDPETSEEAVIAYGELVARHILVDWKELDAPGGNVPQRGKKSKAKPKALPYTQANAVALLTNPEYKDLVVGILRSSASADTFIYQIASDDGGKSESGSSGSSDD